MTKSTYQKSEKHLQNAANARQIISNTKYSCIKCRNSYCISAFSTHSCKPCPICSKIFTGSTNTYCSKSCATTFNNSQRTKESRKKQSLSVKKSFESNPDLKNHLKNYKLSLPQYSKIKFHYCKTCEKYFYVTKNLYNKRLFCSSNCATISRMSNKTHHNGNKKLFKYFNNHLQTIITLESTWELKIAQYLDSINIVWIRPEPIPWKDKNQKSHLYYPDFYLPLHDIYLDPKNPHVMNLDSYKMSVIEKEVHIIYGSIPHIKNTLSAIF